MNLELAGYRVVTALEGREALQRVAVERFDLILLDDLMPGMEGLEVLRNLKASPEMAAIPVIMLAERADDAAVFRAYQAGVDADLTKPINPRELLTYVKHILDGQAGVEEAELEIPIRGGPSPADESPLLRLAHTLLGQALGDGASELRVEPHADRVDILFRTGGELYEVMRLPKRLQRKLIARYKLMADLDTKEMSVPQDGRITMTHKGEAYAARVHSQPAPHGETLLMAISKRSCSSRG
jgi:CheY-like chemotaxis protein